MIVHLSMGEAVVHFGPLANLEALTELLTDTAGLLASLKGELADSQAAMDARQERNGELRARLEEMKGEMSGKMGAVMSKMMNIMGQDPEDILTDEEIQKLLNATFKSNQFFQCRNRILTFGCIESLTRTTLVELKRENSSKLGSSSV